MTVDDDPAVLAAIERDLRRHYQADYRVLKARSGAEGLKAATELAARNAPVALFLVDQRMPGMTGTDLARAVRDRWPHLRLGLMTGWDEAESPVGEASSVVDFVIAKPFKLSALLSAYAGAPAEGG